MSTRNDVEMGEEKTDSSIVQQLPSDEVETDEEGSDYGSTFESFRSKDDVDDQYCLQETEESEKKKMMTTSDQQHTVEKDEVSSDEGEMDDGSTIGPLRSSTSLSVSEFRWGPCLEVEEYDEGDVVFSRSSSSTSDARETRMGKQKVVIKVAIADAKERSKALQTVAGFHGVSSISEENGQISVVVDGIDPVKITECLGKKLCGFAELVTCTDEGIVVLISRSSSSTSSLSSLSRSIKKLHLVFDLAVAVLLGNPVRLIGELGSLFVE